MLDAGASHGYELGRELEARGLSIDRAALYRTLGRLERNGWVQSRWMRPVTGPRRRLYRLTRKGRRALEDVAGLIVDIRDIHDTFVQAHAHAVEQRPTPELA